jgi:Transposase IS116/IS110/IS902 family
LLLTVPGISWVLAYTIAAEIGDIERFASPPKLAGYVIGARLQLRASDLIQCVVQDLVDPSHDGERDR